MKILVSMIFLLISFSVFAIPSIKPGLWKLESTGDDENVLTKISTDKKRQLETVHGQVVAAPKVEEVCLTSQMLKSKSFINLKEKSRCSHKLESQTATEMTTSFSCDDGSKGSGTWKMNKGQSYSGTLNIVTRDGASKVVTHKGTLVSSKCP